VTLTNGYCTTDELKARIGISNADDDTILENVITAVSRWIDTHTGRRFYAASETRYFTADEYAESAPLPTYAQSLRVTGRGGQIVYVNDLLTVTTLKTDDDGDRTYETTWAATDYDLLPDNALLNGEPYTQVRLAPNGRYTFPLHRRGVQIVGSFGYAATTPAMVKEACLLQSHRLWKRKDAVFGVAGASEMGQILVQIKADPDVQELLKRYIKVWVA
jgi:hypothetical protein